MTDVLAVLLSGGAGTRLWPLSRKSHPKQFLPLAGDATMLQDTWRRVAPLSTSAPIVVANEEHRFLAAEQMRQAGVEHPGIILEPVGRNTAPAIAAAALHAIRDGDDPLLLVLPSDHLVRDVEGLRAAVRNAAPAAVEGRLVTFGIVPDRAETGFGYIRVDTARRSSDGARHVAGFVEKPDAATAAEYLASGSHFWNSGMFLFRATRYLDELRRCHPDISAAVSRAYTTSRQDGDFLRLDAEAFASCPSESIDYAVMEHTDTAAMLPIDIGWSDVGSWSALWETSKRDAEGNACFGDVIAVDTRNCYARASRLVALVGVEDLVVIDTDDALMVAHRDEAQQVRTVVAMLEQGQRDQALLHREVYRPWGSYDCVDAGPGFQVKRIKVRPGARLSLQSHQHRAEHWIVVRGTARVERDGDAFELHANQSTYIPPGTRHRLENPGSEMLELIEVQTGDYLGEDDIVRYDDIYGRT